MGTSRFGWTRDKQKGPAGRAAKARTESEEGHGGSRRPLIWPKSEASVAATIAFQNFNAHVLVSSSFFFLGAALLHASLHILWHPYCVHSAPLCEFRRVHEDGVCAPWSVTYLSRPRPMRWQGDVPIASSRIAASVHTASLAAVSHHSAVVASGFVSEWNSRVCGKASSLISLTLGIFRICCAANLPGDNGEDGSCS